MNRFLRLFPVYWFFLGVFIIIASAYALISGHLLGCLSAWRGSAGISERILGVLANGFIVGSDWIELAGNLSKVPGVHVNELIAIQPVWSLAVEITFYAFAPWVIRWKTIWQVALFLGCLLLRAAIFKAGGEHWTFWLYYFSPATWVFFLAGVISYCLLSRLNQWPMFDRWAVPLGSVVCILMPVLIIVYYMIPELRFQDWRYYVLLWLSLPFIFESSKRWGIDARFAALSYPLYLSHWVVLSVYAPLRHYIPDNAKIYFVIGASVAMSLAALAFDKKVQLRFKRVV